MRIRRRLLLLFAASQVCWLGARVNCQDFPDRKVEVEPKLISKAELEFPKEALLASVSARLYVKVLVGKDGVPIKTEIVQREPEMAFLLDEQARRWCMKCRFSPAQDSSGSPVEVWVMIPIHFRIRDYNPPVLERLAEVSYPEEAREMGLEGWVGLAVPVSHDGEADLASIIIVAREPQNTGVFDSAARLAASRSHYRAAYLGDRTVAGWCFIKIPFTIR